MEGGGVVGEEVVEADADEAAWISSGMRSVGEG